MVDVQNGYFLAAGPVGARIWYDVCIEPEFVVHHSLHIRGARRAAHDSIVESRLCIVQYIVAKLIDADAETTENPV